MWEQRWHPLREEWVIIAAHRQDRPWTGEMMAGSENKPPEFEPSCHLCPGNPRVNGDANPTYKQTYIFDNDHACVGWDAPKVVSHEPGIYQVMPARGVSRVLCYSPMHNLTLAEFDTEEIVHIFRVWREQYLELGANLEINHVLIFENKGEVVGVSNPHPHCQIYATNFVFKLIETEVLSSRNHFEKTGRPLFKDILREEQEDGRRILSENDSAIAFVPYFARYAYEVFVAPKETHQSLDRLSEEELLDLAAVLRQVLVKYDNLWQMPFPYVMSLHQAPTNGEDHSGFHFHIEFHPPLRKPDLLKYLAGPEIGGGNFLSDTSPEDKAAELRKQASIHYKKR